MRFLRYVSIVLVGLSCALAVSATGHDAGSNEALLARLDSVLANHGRFVELKESRIDSLRRTLGSARSDSERLKLTGRLYDEYIVYDSDSALHYASESKRLASQIAPDDYDLFMKWNLNKAFVYTVQGLLDRAMELLNNTETDRLSQEVKSRYFEVLSHAYSMRSLYLKPNDVWKEDVDRAIQYRDSITAGGDDWLWVPIAMTVDNGAPDADAVAALDVAQLKALVDNATDNPTRQNAINAYWLSRYYGAMGDEEMMMRYMILAAIHDTQIVNREIAALQEVATYLFNHGDLNRAYNYLLYTANQANAYHNLYRLVALYDILPTVRDAYRVEIEKRDRRLSMGVVALAVLSLVLLGSIGFIIVEYMRLKKTRNLLDRANKELSISIEERDEAIARLEKTNGELDEANKQKLGILAYAFKLTTQCISAMEDYRRQLMRKYKTKHIDDLGALINDPELQREQYQTFYESFDKTILSLFPDIVEEYNKSATDENRVDSDAVAKSGTLNTRLRIHALRRLGITKSADIAQMLNVSIRTVYNNRG